LTEDSSCACGEGRFGGGNFERSELGMDRHFGEVTLLRCKRCRQLWLHYYYVNEAFTGSGRWYHGVIAPELESSVTLDTAHDILEKLDEYWCGGEPFRRPGVQEAGKAGFVPVASEGRDY
jgi:hypothetical protein